MKRILLMVFVSLTLTSAICAQSDYERVQVMKGKYEELKNSIQYLNNVDEAESLRVHIADLKNEYAGDEELLDKVLYPDTYETYFEKIEDLLEARIVDFSKISDLSTEVEGLKGEVATLSEENKSLFEEITTLQAKSNKDDATIASLRQLNIELKNNIKKRDLLVRGIIDTLLTEYLRSPTTLDEAEKQTMIGEIENKSLFYNIERVISDNVEYLKVTEMGSQDFLEMKNEYETFNSSWKQFGTKLAEVYLNRREKEREISYIDELFFKWNTELETALWQKINNYFHERDIVLLDFNNGKQFKNSIFAFIDGAMKNIGLVEEKEAQKLFDVFANGVYFKTIQPEWMPILVDKQLLSKDDKMSIEAKISDWNEAVYPAPSLFWLYFIIGVIIIVQLVLYVRRRSIKSTSSK